MLNRTIRHWMVAIGLVAVAGITAASAAGLVRAACHTPATASEHAGIAAVSGDLGEVTVYAPMTLGAGLIHAPHDLGEVLVQVPRLPAADTFLAQIVVSAPRDRGVQFANDGAVAIAAVR